MFFFVLMVYCLKQYKLHCFPTSPYSSFIHFLDLKFEDDCLTFHRFFLIHHMINFTCSTKIPTQNGLIKNNMITRFFKGTSKI